MFLSCSIQVPHVMQVKLHEVHVISLKLQLRPRAVRLVCMMSWRAVQVLISDIWILDLPR